MITTCMVFLFLFNIMLYGQTLSPTPTPVSKIANTIIVAKSGGEYSKIQDAVDAATAGTTILVYPGTYEEQVILPSGVSLVGTDKYNCKIVKSIQGTGYDTAYWLVVVNNSEVRNLYIENTFSGYTSTAIGIKAGGGGKISNCIIKGSGWDLFIIQYNSYPVLVENCYIENSINGAGGDTFVDWADGVLADSIIRNCIVKNIGSPYTLWLGGSQGDTKPQFYDCCFLSASPGGHAAIRTSDNYSHQTEAYFTNCQFLDVNTLAPKKLLEIYSGNGRLTTIYLQNCIYSTLGDLACTYNTILTGIQDFISLKISGTERIDSSGNVKGATLSSGGNTVADASGGLASYTTLWKDWAACAGQPSFVDESTWHPAMDDNMTYMHCTTDTKYLLFEIPYEAGTVLTRLRVKWQAEGMLDGIIMRLVKRNESAAGKYWTIVGAPQTYIDSTGVKQVRVTTYDLPDETMAANYSYSIEIESEKITSGVKLFSVGVETSKRVY